MSTSVITTAGLAAAASAGSSGPQIRVAYAKIGSAIITPDFSMTDVATPVYTVPANRITYQVIDTSTIMFTIDIDNTVGDFKVGNFGFFLDDGTMFCITALSAQDDKRKTTVSQVGNGRRYQQVITLSGMATITDLTLIVPDEAALPEVPTENDLPAASGAPYPVYLVRAHSSFNGRPVLACRYSGAWWWAPTVDSSGGDNGLILSSSLFESGIAEGTCVYLDITGGTPIFRAADGNDQAKKPLGIKGSGNSIYLPGSVYTSPNSSAYTINSTYYCAGTTGALTLTESSAPVGFSIAANKILINMMVQGKVAYNDFTIEGSTSSVLDLVSQSNSSDEKIWRIVNTSDNYILRAMSDDKTTFQDAYSVDRSGTSVITHYFNTNGSNSVYIDNTGLVAASGKRITASRYEFKDYADSWFQVGATSYLQQFDAGDYLNYDKSNNTYFWLVANTTAMKLYANGLSVENNRNIYINANQSYLWNSLASGIQATAAAMAITWDSNDYLAYSKSENLLRFYTNNVETLQVGATSTTATNTNFTITNTTPTDYKGFRFEQSGYGLYATSNGRLALGDINNGTASYYFSYKNANLYMHGIYNQVANKNLLEVKYDSSGSGFSQTVINGDLNLSSGNPGNANYPQIRLSTNGGGFFGLMSAFNISNVADYSPLLALSDLTFIAYHTAINTISIYNRDTDKSPNEAKGMVQINRNFTFIYNKLIVGDSVAGTATQSKRTSNFTSGDFTVDSNHIGIQTENAANGGGAAIGFLVNQLGVGTYGCRVGVDTSGNLRFGGGSFLANAHTFFPNGNVTIQGTLTQSSDRRLKSNIRPLDNALDVILSIFGRRYIKNGKEEIGFIAQEIEEYLPEFVTEDEKGMKSVNYAGMTAVLVEGFKSLAERIKKLESK